MTEIFADYVPGLHGPHRDALISRLVDKWYPVMVGCPPYPDSMAPLGARQRALCMAVMENCLAWLETKRVLEGFVNALEAVRVKRAGR